MSIILTGIKPTGDLHLGNYLGAIRPALAQAAGHEARFFIADIHALNLGGGGPRLRQASLDVAAGWLACGLDPATAVLYLQSDVPEVTELAALLMPVCPKGLMNRAHAYKASGAANRAAGRDPDDGINMGLYTYPVLMAADILALGTDLVPVGSDQVQHVEMTIDLARAAKRRWGAGTLKEPRAEVAAYNALVPGTDGRKMSKSYGNVVPLFAAPGTLATLVRRVTTDSLPADAPKDPASNVLAAWFRCALPAQADGFEARLRAGAMGWGEAKAEVTQAIQGLVGPLNRRFQELRRDEEALRKVLRRGADQARAEAGVTLTRVRRACYG